MNNIYNSILHICCCIPKKLYIIDLHKDNSIHNSEYIVVDLYKLPDIKSMEDFLIKSNNIKKIEINNEVILENIDDNNNNINNEINDNNVNNEINNSNDDNMCKNAINLEKLSSIE